MKNERKQLKAWLSADTYHWLTDLVIEAGYTYGKKDIKPHWGKFLQAWKDGKFKMVPTNIKKDIDN